MTNEIDLQRDLHALLFLHEVGTIGDAAEMLGISERRAFQVLRMDFRLVTEAEILVFEARQRELFGE